MLITNVICICTCITLYRYCKLQYFTYLKISHIQNGVGPNHFGYDRMHCTVVNREITDKIATEVDTMLENGAILPIRDYLNQGFYSRIFLVPKKDGQSTPAINLHPLNQHLLYQHFKMESIHVVRDLLQEGIG